MRSDTLPIQSIERPSRLKRDSGRQTKAIQVSRYGLRDFLKGDQPLDRRSNTFRGRLFYESVQVALAGKGGAIPVSVLHQRISLS